MVVNASASEIAYCLLQCACLAPQRSRIGRVGQPDRMSDSTVIHSSARNDTCGSHTYLCMVGRLVTTNPERVPEKRGGAPKKAARMSGEAQCL